MASDVLAALEAKKLSLATAESCTGGGVGQALTAVPGSSRVYRGGIISYTNEVKSGLLHVPETLLRDLGAVSGPVAEAMARGAMYRDFERHAHEETCNLFRKEVQ